MRIQFAFCLLVSSSLSFGQIKNPGFEVSRDTLQSLPQNWNVKQIDGFEFKLANEVSHSGQNSFRIQTLNGSSGFASFSQLVEFDVRNFKRIAISVFIKSSDIDGHAGLWCQIWDKNDKKIGFQNLAMQGTEIKGTNEWKKYSLYLITSTNCKKLLLGGYLQGKGAVWYDQFTIEDQEFSTTPPSKEVSAYVAELTRITRKHSIYSKSVDWKQLNTETKLLSKGAQTYEDASMIAPHVLNKLRELGDNHSYIMPKESHEKSEISNLDGRHPHGELLENNIGYVYIPGFASLSDTVSENFAKSIQNIIRDLDISNEIKGWIVDLRENSGGNMWPMITGLGPLIGEGLLGHFHKPNNKVHSQWSYSHNSKNAVKVDNPYVLKNDGTKVAILIGPNTASSGEMTAISFIGKPNTRLFGQPTAGYLTANRIFPLKDGSALALASSYVSDRNKKIYKDKIHPDVMVENDTDIHQISSQWILQKDKEGS